MKSFPHHLKAKSLIATIALCTLPSIAIAQPCALQVKAHPKVLLPGATAKVDVLARYPVGAYAFAASAFDVSASIPWWTWVTHGAVVSGDVTGIESSQPHQPALGVLADPQQPYHAWSGHFRPETNAPALVSFKAMPTDFWYYPSVLTSSSAPCSAAAGEAWIFVNPIRSGPFAAAPGKGDTVRAVPEGFAAATQDDHLLMGLLLPTEPAPRQSTVRTTFDVPPTTFSARTEVMRENLSLNFTKVTFSQTQGGRSYELLAEVPDSTEMQMEIRLLDGGVRTLRSSNGRFPVQFDRIPSTFAKTVTRQPSASGPVKLEVYSFSWGASNAGSFNVALPDGTFAICRGVTVLAWARVDGTSSSQNSTQPTLGAHYYESTGARQMIVSPNVR